MESYYKLLQGDCLELMKEIPEQSIDMVLCDLPYGTTACRWDNIIDLKQLWSEYKRIIKPDGAIVLFGSEPFSSILRTSNIKDYKYDWVWNKKLAGNGILAKKQPLKIHENIIVFNSKRYYPQMTKGKKRRKMTGGMSTHTTDIFNNSKTFTEEYENDLYYPKTIIDFSVAGLRGKKIHSAQKPVALCEYLINTYTNKGDTVLDNCMGSGTTGVAAINLNRNFIGIEIDKEIFDTAENRIKQLKS